MSYQYPAGNQSGVQTQESVSESPNRDTTAILVLGFNRPYHLQTVLESLRLQGRIRQAHIWLDGTQGRGEYQGQNEHSLAIAERYPVGSVRAQRTHLGIEKLMLDALNEITHRYERVIVLEDDCFPVEDGISLFEDELTNVRGRTEIYSVYGHHFGVEAEECQDFSRFQGWGWAAYSARIQQYLPRLRELFMMTEAEYLTYVRERLTDEVKARLDVTPGRNVLSVLQSFFSWDSATALLTALDGVSHRRTVRRAVINTGIVEGIGHFHEDSERLRNAPFNMIPLNEAWDHFDTTTQPCRGEKQSYGLDGLDQKLVDAVPVEGGYFVELGAYDGVTQSNSVLLEGLGWAGLLIEANPGAYARCVKARPDAEVVHAACVGNDFKRSMTTITDVGLMSMTEQTDLEGGEREEWLERGEGFIGRDRMEIEVRAATLSGILESLSITVVHLLILDVEGAEVNVLRGLDLERHAPWWIVAEDGYDENVSEYLTGAGYRRVKVLMERQYTRDCLYERCGC